MRHEIKEPFDTPMAFPPGADNREFIWTYSGQKFFYDDPGPGIRIQDIAHALSQLCRWTGHTKEFYSIAEHCVRCSWYPGKLAVPENPQSTDQSDYRRKKYLDSLPYNPPLALHKLLHDAVEAYVNDLNKPLKNLLKFSGVGLQRTAAELSEYDIIEARVERAIWKKYGLEPPSEAERSEIKAADLALAMTEARDLLNQTSVTHYEGAKPLLVKLEPWSPAEAEEKFLQRFKELM